MSGVNITFTILIDDVEQPVNISQPSGTSGGYHIYINKYFHGQLFKRSYGWDKGLAPKSFLTTDDLQIIYDIIDGVTPIP